MALTQEELKQANTITIDSSIDIQLPELPLDPALREQFLKLTPDEQKSFYIKRRFLIGKLASGLTKPGLKSGIRWVKNQIFAFKDFAVNEFTGAQTMVGQGDAFPLEISQENLPLLLSLRQDATINTFDSRVEENQTEEADPKTKLLVQKVQKNLSAESQAFVESTVTGLVENMWKNSVDIAKSNGLGLTFVGGTIFNTTLGKKGFVWGRSLSIDIGVDFKNQNGYIRFLYDKQALKNAGLSFDVGLMFDTLVHITNTEVGEGESVDATHVKLPIIGCFRSGPNYKAWGTQLGISVLEMAGGWLSLHGFPLIGSGMITGTRAIGIATVYSTTLNRQVLKTYEMPQFILKLPGFKKLMELTKELKFNEGPILCKDAI
jgi:hypothetical protein